MEKRYRVEIGYIDFIFRGKLSNLIFSDNVYISFEYRVYEKE